MHIEEEIASTVPSLRTQTLPYLRQLEDVDELGKRKDRGRIDSQFIIAVSLEDHFKEFLDEVASKVVLNG